MHILNQGIRTMAPIFHFPLAALLAIFLVWAPAAFSQQKTFPSPEEAMKALGEAVATNNEEAKKALLGADFRTLIPPVGTEVRTAFLAAWAKSDKIVHEGETKAMIAACTRPPTAMWRSTSATPPPMPWAG